MNIFYIIASISLIVPIPVGLLMNIDYCGTDFPIFVGLILQAILGNFILYYVKGYEGKARNLVFVGYFIFFLGLSGAYLSGKTIWIAFWWEVSTVGAIFLYSGTGFGKKTISSFIALSLASSISAIFLLAWVFLPESRLGYQFLMAALMLKAAFSGLHIWLPEAHSGPPGHGSAAFSGLMVNLPLLLFVRFLLDKGKELSGMEVLIPIASIGIFFGGISGFFEKDAKRALAYSTIEKCNFMWFSLLMGTFWINSNIEDYRYVSKAFIVLFYIIIIHHSFSKVFQFLALGYITKIAGSTIIDECKGIGRISGFSSFQLGAGTFSFASIPGTSGFFMETFLLLLISKLIDVSTSVISIIFLFSALMILIGMVIGTFSHLRLFLPVVLSVPSKAVSESVKSNHPNIHSEIYNSIVILGYSIFIVPVLFIFPLFFSFALNSYLSLEFIQWLRSIGFISLACSIGYIVIIVYRRSITKRRLWDCGTNYVGSELSITSSLFSDPLYDSFGRYFINKNGEIYIDHYFQRGIIKFFNIGKYWIQKVEEGSISFYMFISALSVIFVMSVFAYLLMSGHY